MIKIENPKIVGWETTVKGIKNPTNNQNKIDNIFIYADITAPLYWWKEFDTYIVSMIVASCSAIWKDTAAKSVLETVIFALNSYCELYLSANDKRMWWRLNNLPLSYEQCRTVITNYEVLSNIYNYRRNHKFDEWKEFFKWARKFPYNSIAVNKTEEE